jgi:hypothetical protein
LAKEAGLEVNNGIIVDEYLRSSHLMSMLPAMLPTISIPTSTNGGGWNIGVTPVFRAAGCEHGGRQK